MNDKDIAQVCHEVNRAYCVSIGDDSQVPWDEASDHQKASSLKGVDFHKGSEKSPEESHQAWMETKLADGWLFGEEKNEELKTHPCLIPYEELPIEQKAKDYLFAAVVDVMTGLNIEATPVAPVAATIAPIAIVGKGMVPIRYVGKRDSHRDGIYDTGLVWAKGQVLPVPGDKAALMIRHIDVYELVEAKDIVDDTLTDTTEGNKEDNKKLDDDDFNEDAELVRDSIRQMGRKAQLLEFAKTNFNIDLETGPKVKVAELQESCIRLIDQYGLPE